jgi:hypothetical protein
MLQSRADNDYKYEQKMAAVEGMFKLVPHCQPFLRKFS